MDTMTFLSEIAKTLIWPITIVTIILILRKPIRVLILSIRRFQYADLAIEFGRQVRFLAEKYQKIIPELAEIKSQERDPVADFLKNSARIVVARAVRELENTVREAPTNKILAKDHTELYNKLMDLGQMAILAPEHSLDICALQDYLRMVRRLTMLLRSF